MNTLIRSNTVRNLLKVHGSEEVLARTLGGGFTCKDHGVLKEGVDLDLIFSPRLNSLVAVCCTCLDNSGMEIMTSAVYSPPRPLPEPRPCPLCGDPMVEKLAEHLQDCKGRLKQPIQVNPPGVCNSPVCGDRVEKACMTCHFGFCGAHISLGGKEGAPICFACQRKTKVN